MPSAFYERAELEQDKTQPSHMIVVMSSDRGLCGGVHSGICRELRHLLQRQKSDVRTNFVVIGDKAKGILQRYVRTFVWVCAYICVTGRAFSKHAGSLPWKTSGSWSFMWGQQKSPGILKQQLETKSRCMCVCV